MGRVCVLTPYSELLSLNSKQSGDINSGGGARTNSYGTFGLVTHERDTP